MNLNKLSDEILLSSTKDLVRQEREITLNVLHHLLEVERRQLFARLGFSSLFEYAVKELGYSEGSAHRRITSMRLLKTLPEIEAKIKGGALPLSTLSQAQSFFRQEQMTRPEAKIELLNSLEGKSTREVEKILVMASSQPQMMIREKLRPLSDTLHHLSFTIDDELLKKIEELKALLSHRNPNMNIKDILEFTVEESLKKHRVKAPKEEEIPAPKVEKTQKKSPSRYIAAEVKRRVWQRDGGQCTYVDPKSGRRCESRHLLELDHIEAFAMDGESTVENLRLRCCAHNRLAAIDTFGRKKMEKFVERMRS